MSLPTTSRRPAAPLERVPHLLLLRREVDAREEHLRDVDDRRRPPAPAGTSASSSIPSSTPSAPRARGGAASTAARARARAAPRRRGRARGRSSSCRRRRRGRPSSLMPAPARRRERRSAAISPSRRSSVIGSWPISGCVRSALRAVTGSPRHRRLGREPLVGGDVLREAEQLGRERRLRRAARRPRARSRAGTSTTSSARARRASSRCACRPPGRRRCRRERATQRGRRLAVERAPALLEQGGLLVHAGIAYARAARARAPRRPPRAARRRSCSTSTSWQ